MTVHLEFLTDVPMARIAGAFNQAFADYYLQMGERAEVWLRNRMIKNAVDLDCSVGAFAGEALVGFSLTGIDTWEGEPAAFDAATGIVPAFRGQGLARRMFDFALPVLRRRGVRRFLLEVLQVNEPAIKAYRRVGFEVTREFDCFEGATGAEAPGEPGAGGSPIPEGVSVRAIAKEQVLDLAGELDGRPSWENSLASIRRIPDEVLAFGAWDAGRLAGTIVYYPLLGWVMNLVVRRALRRRGIGSLLLSHLRGRLPAGTARIRFVNVPHEDRGMIAFLERRGFTRFTAQYEMEMPLG